MSILDLAASPIFSGLTGGLFSLGGAVVKFFQTRQSNAHELALRDKDRELLQLSANLEQAKAAGILALARENGASEAFTASINAEGAIRGEPRWAAGLRASVRPVLVYTYQLAFFACLGVALLAWWMKWATEAEMVPLVQYMVVAVINTATMTVSWYFGQRQMDKVAVSWGNKYAGAAVTPGKP